MITFHSHVLLTGDFVDDMPHGRVMLIRPDGEKIEGQFKHGMPHGRITWTSPRKGQRMDGTFRMGRPHGQAKVFGSDGEVVYEGRFVHGKPVKDVPKDFNTDIFKF